MKTDYHKMLIALGFTATDEGGQTFEIYRSGDVKVEVALYSKGQKLIVDREVIAMIDN